MKVEAATEVRVAHITVAVAQRAAEAELEVEVQVEEARADGGAWAVHVWQTAEPTAQSGAPEGKQATLVVLLKRHGNTKEATELVPPAASAAAMGNDFQTRAHMLAGDMTASLVADAKQSEVDAEMPMPMPRSAEEKRGAFRAILERNGYPGFFPAAAPAAPATALGNGLETRAHTLAGDVTPSLAEDTGHAQAEMLRPEPRSFEEKLAAFRAILAGAGYANVAAALVPQAAPAAAIGSAIETSADMEGRDDASA